MAVFTTIGIADAGDISELEPNHPIEKAQLLALPTGTLAIDGELGNGGSNDLDFFSFQGQAGDVVTLDIDGGVGGARSVDTVIAVFGPAPEYRVLRMNDDAPLDEGSISTSDSRIDNFVLPATGRYTVGVSNYPRYFMNGGLVQYPTYVGTGDYTLVVSGVTPAIKQVSIEVKPGNDGLAPINPKSRGKIPVAILGAPDFDALTIDPATLTFGPTGAEKSLAKCNWTGEDVNADGRVDRVCHFENQKAGFQPGDLEGILRGKTAGGVAFEGRAWLKIVPQKRRE